MPVKNAAPFLFACLQSIQQQEFVHWELLAVNDHSSDSSLEILQEFSIKDPRIIVFQNPGQGIIEALRHGYANSSGALITRMDADDLMPSCKLKVMHKHLIELGEGHVATGLVEYFSEDTLGEGYRNYANWLNALTRKSANFKAIYKECVIPSPCWMMHRSDLDRIGAFDADRYPEDYDLCFRMYAEKLRLCGSPKILHYWRDHGNRASRNDPNYRDQGFIPLKLHYWFQLERDTSRPLVLWGAGKKGKAIAAQMEQRGAAFTWVCETPNKIGHRIGNTVLKHADSLDELPEPQIIVAVSAPDGQVEIQQKLSDRQLAANEHYWFFF